MEKIHTVRHLLQFRQTLVVREGEMVDRRILPFRQVHRSERHRLGIGGVHDRDLHLRELPHHAVREDNLRPGAEGGAEDYEDNGYRFLHSCVLPSILPMLFPCSFATKGMGAIVLSFRRTVFMVFVLFPSTKGKYSRHRSFRSISNSVKKSGLARPGRVLPRTMRPSGATSSTCGIPLKLKRVVSKI